ncbi:transmembrane protein 270 [Trichechus manatus latirostris]|uniref:Transmembrane protein 270 n=1 Tax=Trichechus manatus latirostris TaxID=127582 RepID=A0A2Y9DTJ1_TRIMA|nr:transmembrane protein 270 [Trichechus manatus latirostris]
MEAVPPARPSLSGILLQVLRLSVLLIQNRIHLYNFLLLKIILFNHWVSGLAQEAEGSCSRQARPPPGGAVCPIGRAVHAGLALIEIPVWLVLWVPRLMWGSVLGCARALGLSPRCLDAWQQLDLSLATWMDLLVSCLHSLMLVALLLLLLVWRLCRMAHRFSLGQLPSKALLENHMLLELLALLKRLYWWVENMAALTSWHLAYLITWTTCLASHLLQAAFEHTVQLAQETEPQEASWTLPESPLPESLTPEAGPALPEPEAPGE